MSRYSDAQLILFVQKAARRINRVLSLTGTDEEISVNADGSLSTSNADLEDLVLLQAECLIASTDVNSDIADGVAITDGEQSIDTNTKSRLRVDYLNSEYSPCAEVEKAIRDENLTRSAGKMVW